jgi:alanine dehydrogenase
MHSETLILSRRDVTALLTLDECIREVEASFRALSDGTVPAPAVLGFHMPRGGFHAKVGALGNDVVLKLNANFPSNRKRFGLPTIQGLILLFDAETGYPLAVMDSVEITILRTGAATAVAARYLARPESAVVTVCGCGNQGRIQLRSLAAVLPISKVLAFDVDEEVQGRFVEEMSRLPGIAVAPASDLEHAVGLSNVVVTCTPSREFYIRKPWITPGTFIAAVGADSEEKQELEPAVLAGSRVVVDILEQCEMIGDLHHAIREGAMSRDQIHGTLGDVVAGKKEGRTSPEQVFVFDSTGTALQDVAVARIAYQKAREQGRGMSYKFLE